MCECAMFAQKKSQTNVEKDNEQPELLQSKDHAIMLLE
jgi:hypothetical protein